MKILCHRGFWKKEEEKNTVSSIQRAFSEDMGIESDIRDINGKLVISHNPPVGNEPLAEEIFRLMQEYGDRYCFAINIKADGLTDLLARQLQEYKINNYFTFDMSVPQMLDYREKKLRYFTRQSEYEKQPVLYEDAAGVWTDAFEEDSWITEELILAHQRKGKIVCIVSPELHQREKERFWRRLCSFSIDWNQLLLCTDCPGEARNFFTVNGR